MTKHQFRMTAVLGAEKLRLMSEVGSPLPRLSTLMAELPERFIEAIEEELLPAPLMKLGTGLSAYSDGLPTSCISCR